MQEMRSGLRFPQVTVAIKNQDNREHEYLRL